MWRKTSIYSPFVFFLFKPIWIRLYIQNNFPNINIQLDAELHFPIFLVLHFHISKIKVHLKLFPQINFKFTTISERLFKTFSLFYNFYLIIFILFFIISFQTLIHKETSRLQSLSHVAYFEFFLWNTLHNAENKNMCKIASKVQCLKNGF